MKRYLCPIYHWEAFGSTIISMVLVVNAPWPISKLVFWVGHSLERYAPNVFNQYYIALYRMGITRFKTMLEVESDFPLLGD